MISYHLRDVGWALVTVGYICYHEKEPCVNIEKRSDGMTVVQQQGMEVLDVNLSLSMSFKDRFTVRPHVMLNAA